jgi:linoleoyl-CoA desaturase
VAHESATRVEPISRLTVSETHDHLWIRIGDAATGPAAVDEIEGAREVAAEADESSQTVKFGASDGFQVELRRRVETFFRATGRRQRDCRQMYVKTVILVAVLATSYLLLVLKAQTWWQALPLAILLGLAAAGIGFNTQHDGGHRAYSNHPWINTLMAMTLDLIGGSSYVWNCKHAILHHTYVNITNHDTDIDLGIFARLTPEQKWLWFHRWQHVYLWPLYGLLAIKWHLLTDFRNVITGRIRGRRFRRPMGWQLTLFLVGKAIFLIMTFGIPAFFHPVWVVLLYYGVAALVLGITLSVVFQLAHCVEQAEFPLPRPDTGRIENAWAIHQAETTVDFARRSRLASWLLGGLNFQIEHHLFPRICHVNYPAMSKVVEETCREFGVKYMEHPSFRSGLASHFRWLRRMAMPSPRVTCPGGQESAKRAPSGVGA